MRRGRCGIHVDPVGGVLVSVVCQKSSSRGCRCSCLVSLLHFHESVEFGAQICKLISDGGHVGIKRPVSPVSIPVSISIAWRAGPVIEIWPVVVVPVSIVTTLETALALLVDLVSVVSVRVWVSIGVSGSLTSVRMKTSAMLTLVFDRDLIRVQSAF